MSDEVFEAYRHSGRWHPAGPGLALLVAIVLALPLGFAYAYFEYWMPLIYLNALATAGYGVIFGVVAGASVKRGKVRNELVALAAGVLAGGIGLYGAWVGHIHAVYEDAPFVLAPWSLWTYVVDLNGQGSWGLSDDGNVTGSFLWVVWIAEALTVLGIGAGLARSIIHDVPFCEEDGCWLDEVKNIDTLQQITGGPGRAALRRGDLSPLAGAKPLVAGSTKWMRLVLKSSPRTDMRVLRLVDVRQEKNKEGKFEEKAEDITGDLVVPKEMYELIERFEQLEPVPRRRGGRDAPAGEAAAEEDPDDNAPSE